MEFLSFDNYFIAKSKKQTLIGMSQKQIVYWLSLLKLFSFTHKFAENYFPYLLHFPCLDFDEFCTKHYTTGQKKRDTFYFSIENPIKPTLREQL